MLNHFHKCEPIQKIIKKLTNFSRWKSNKFQRVAFFPNNENLELAYASYELTDSFTENNPEPTPVFVLHGLMASKNNWNSLCRNLHNTKKCKVISLDARNHGESPHTHWHSYDHLVVDLRCFIEKMNLKSVHLIGHCMGGRTAMLFALKYPELVEKLIVIDISPISTSPSVKRVPDLLKFLQNLKLPKNVPMHEARRILWDPLFRIVKNKGVMVFLMTNLVQKNDGSYGWRFNIKSLINNADYILSFPEIHNSTFTRPVLFMGGSTSDHIQRSDYPKILELFPNAELKYIDGAGHWLHSDKPEEFLKLTLNFSNEEVHTT